MAILHRIRKHDEKNKKYKHGIKKNLSSKLISKPYIKILFQKLKNKRISKSRRRRIVENNLSLPLNKIAKRFKKSVSKKKARNRIKVLKNRIKVLKNRIKVLVKELYLGSVYEEFFLKKVLKTVKNWLTEKNRKKFKKYKKFRILRPIKYKEILFLNAEVTRLAVKIRRLKTYIYKSKKKLLFFKIRQQWVPRTRKLVTLNRLFSPLKAKSLTFKAKLLRQLHFKKYQLFPKKSLTSANYFSNSNVKISSVSPFDIAVTSVSLRIKKLVKMLRTKPIVTRLPHDLQKSIMSTTNTDAPIKKLSSLQRTIKNAIAKSSQVTVEEKFPFPPHEILEAMSKDEKDDYYDNKRRWEVKKAIKMGIEPVVTRIPREQWDKLENNQLKAMRKKKTEFENTVHRGSVSPTKAVASSKNLITKKNAMHKINQFEIKNGKI